MMEPLDAAAIRQDAACSLVGRRVRCLGECDSTNLEALRLAESEGRAADGTVIFAEHQTAGHGRHGRPWYSPRGAGLLMTAIVFGEGSVAPTCVLAAGIAVHDAVHETAGVDATLAWPNDAYVRDRKLAGVLVETSALSGESAMAIGIGVNCLQQRPHFAPEIRDRATSLEIESAHAVSRHDLAVSLLRHLNLVLPRALHCDGDLILDWRERSGDLGRRARLRHGGREFSGTVVDIDASHGLWLQLDGGGRVRFDPMTTSKVA